MSKVERFEDLIAWQRARMLTKAVYEATQQGDFARDYGLSGQMQRAAVSVMSNVAEGYERSSAADFQRFLSSIFALFAYGQAANGMSLHLVECDARSPPGVATKRVGVDDNGKVQRYPTLANAT